MRFAATYFVKLLNERPGLESAAFIIVGWVGVKLLVITLAHEDIAIIPHDFAESTLLEAYLLYRARTHHALIGWFSSSPRKVKTCLIKKKKR